MVVPMAARTGRARSTSAASPPTMIVSVPFAAPSEPPETGASTMRTSRSARCWASSLARTGLIVEQSISIDPGRRPSASPCSPKTTASTSGESRTHVTTMSLVVARSLGLAASVAPSSTSGPVRPGVRFHTVSGKPARARLAAMAAPIVPKPAKPTLSIGPTVEPTGGAGAPGRCYQPVPPPDGPSSAIGPRLLGLVA